MGATSLFGAPARLLYIRGLPVSNHGPVTGYPDLGLSWVFSVPPGECRVSTLQLGHDCFFQILSNSSFTFHPFIRRYTNEVTEEASSNKQIN
jgi:hypothetical protein